MEVRKEVENNKVVFYVAGQIDTGTAADFERAVLGENLGTDIVCDFGGVTYVSSAGLRIILAIHKSQTSAGKELTFVNVSKDIKDIFEMTGFSKFLTVK